MTDLNQFYMQLDQIYNEFMRYEKISWTNCLAMAESLVAGSEESPDEHRRYVFELATKFFGMACLHFSDYLELRENAVKERPGP